MISAASSIYSRRNTGTDRDLDCIMGVRCTSGVLRAKSSERTASCQFDVLGSGQMDTQLQNVFKENSSDPDLLLTSFKKQKGTSDTAQSISSPGL